MPNLTLEAALGVARDKMNYERCTRPDHGFGKDIEVEGVTAPAVFVICPIVQINPLPTYSFHSEADFLEGMSEFFQQKGWWSPEEVASGD